MANKKISVLIPTYNRANFLPTAIDSVLKQTHQDFELVICDNASTDHSWDILQQYSRQDKRICVFRNKMNLGPVPNWVKCLELSQGEYIKFVYSDDWLERNALELLLECLLASMAEASIGSVKIHDQINGKTDKMLISNSLLRLTTRDIISHLLVNQPRLALSPSALLFKRQYVIQAFSYQPVTALGKWRYQRGYGIDFLPSLLAANAGGIGVVHDHILNFGYNGSNESNKDRIAHSLVLEPWHIIPGEYIQQNRSEFEGQPYCYAFSRFAYRRSIRAYMEAVYRVPLLKPPIISHLKANLFNFSILLKKDKMPN